MGTTVSILQGRCSRRDQLFGILAKNCDMATHACSYYISWRLAAVTTARTRGLHEDFGQQEPSTVDLAPFRKVTSVYLSHSVGLRPSPGFGRLAPRHITSIRSGSRTYITSGRAAKSCTKRARAASRPADWTLVEETSQNSGPEGFNARTLLYVALYTVLNSGTESRRRESGDDLPCR